nr:DinB family protein [uncultured Eisenbergiella sp.]
MKYFGEGLSEKHKELNRIIRNKDKLPEAKKLFLEIHEKLFPSEMTGGSETQVDGLFRDLTDREYAIMPSSKDETIGWAVWHIARIEDLTMNMLVGRREQIFNQDWKQRIQVSVTDTGNAMQDEEIMALSKEMNTPELLKYRCEVGRRTRSLVQSLTPEDMRRNTAEEDLDRILEAGGVTRQEESFWLLDFWGKKDVAGLLLMPPTRHVMLHLNDCFRWKEAIRSKKRFFLE